MMPISSQNKVRIDALNSSINPAYSPPLRWCRNVESEKRSTRAPACQQTRCPLWRVRGLVLPAVAFAKPRVFEVFGGHRSAEVVTLTDIDRLLLQELDLMRRFDAFGDGL